MLPERIRIVTVRGEIDTGLDRDTIAEMDGSAFHRGNELMMGLKESGLPFAMDYGDGVLDEAVSALVSLVWLFREGRSPRQMQAVAAYEELGTQAAVGERLGTTQQNISSPPRTPCSISPERLSTSPTRSCSRSGSAG